MLEQGARRLGRRSRPWIASAVLAAALAAPAVGATIEGSVGELPGVELSGPRPEILALAERAAERALATHPVARPELLTVIDYSLPSTEPRLWVIDRARGRTLYRELVAHGKGSGENVATAFSNRDGSLQSSVGLFLTEGTYVGKNGYSLYLDGLEPGFNDRARVRTIVMHGAPYVSPEFARQHGRLGRSWGCPALDPAVARELIDTIRGGSLLFVYAPEPSWLARSRFVGGDPAIAAREASGAGAAGGAPLVAALP